MPGFVPTVATAALIQRFDFAANLNSHLHCLVLDGVYRCGADGSPACIETGTSTDDGLHTLLRISFTRLMKCSRDVAC